MSSSNHFYDLFTSDIICTSWAWSFSVKSILHSVLLSYFLRFLWLKHLFKQKCKSVFPLLSSGSLSSETKASWFFCGQMFSHSHTGGGVCVQPAQTVLVFPAPMVRSGKPPGTAAACTAATMTPSCPCRTTAPVCLSLCASGLER